MLEFDEIRLCFIFNIIKYIFSEIYVILSAPAFTPVNGALVKSEGQTQESFGSGDASVEAVSKLTGGLDEREENQSTSLYLDPEEQEEYDPSEVVEVIGDDTVGSTDRSRRRRRTEAERLGGEVISDTLRPRTSRSQL